MSVKKNLKWNIHSRNIYKTNHNQQTENVAFLIMSDKIYLSYRAEI